MKRVFITGAAGFIGRQFIFDYGERYHIYGCDVKYKYNPSMRSSHFAGEYSATGFIDLIKRETPEVLIHLAASTNVGDSVKDPVPYYANNLFKATDFIRAVREESPTTKIIFASSAAVYGDPEVTCTEDLPCCPISPYGRQKLSLENYIVDCADYCYTDYVHLRFFNVCGADPLLRCGPDENDFHLIPVVTRKLLRNEPITINGVGYITHDGSCERDYVHVKDVADALHAAIETEAVGIYNIASGIKTSNREVISSIADALGKQVEWDIQPKREGDPSVLVADISKARDILEWEPKLTIEDAITDTIRWYTKPKQ